MQTKALFLGGNGAIAPDYQLCNQCSHAIDGQIPDPMPLNADDPTYSIDKGKPGDLCPPCAKSNLSHLGHWQGHGGNRFPEHLLPLRLFKCHQWYWLVIPGLRENEPTHIQPDAPQ